MLLKTDYIILNADLKLTTIGIMKKNVALSELNPKMCVFVNFFGNFCKFLLLFKMNHVIISHERKTFQKLWKYFRKSI